MRHHPDIATALEKLGFNSNNEMPSLRAINVMYQELALKFHPDAAINVGKSNEEKNRLTEDFKKINNAHEKLQEYFRNPSQFPAPTASARPTTSGDTNHASPPRRKEQERAKREEQEIAENEVRFYRLTKILDECKIKLRIFADMTKSNVRKTIATDLVTNIDECLNRFSAKDLKKMIDMQLFAAFEKNNSTNPPTNVFGRFFSYDSAEEQSKLGEIINALRDKIFTPQPSSQAASNEPAPR